MKALCLAALRSMVLTFSGYGKPANEKKDRKDRRKKVHQSGMRQSAIVMRERGGNKLTHVSANESQGVALVAANFEHGTTFHADEAPHWHKLTVYFPIKRINHNEAYLKDGACTNQVDSFFVVPILRRRDNCHDNAVVESFLQLLKREQVGRRPISHAIQHGRTCSNTLRCSTTRSASTRTTACCHWLTMK